ncbi:MFS transporter [Nocardiopsis sp. RSe5-2]|uniref:MFS transporter n=1 Tax=Nocardiopsis endophytica TaxID=3018445 RepID=A0ABT4TXD5_9ACTN|nr:MFS transporter [Nocardiopsis endophytica]MDA2809357.1 MFS transporter [Nocardiopsis endophytica]
MATHPAPDTPAAPGEPAGPAQAPPVRHRWRNLATLTGSTAVDSTEGNILGTLFPTVAAALGLSNGHLGTITAAGKLASAPAGPLWTWLAARTSRKTVLVATSLLGGAFGIASGLSQDFWSLLVLNTLMAASLVGGSPVANALIMDSFSDRDRGRAISYFYGAAAGIGSFMGPVLGLFTLDENGWRLGLMAMGAVAVLAGLAQWALVRDPGIGASEPQLADLDRRERGPEKASLRAILGLFRVPSYTVMMVSRLLSGHLLIPVYGVTFLATERGFDNATAAVVLAPFGIGYIVGTLGGGELVKRLDTALPDRGRVWYIQAAQLLFAGFAFAATQADLGGIGFYAALWALMGATQGMNPPVNRPIVSSVIPPHLRGQAMAVFITVFETIGWAAFSLGAGRLADSIGLQAVFLWVLVALMAANAAVLGILHLTYPRDVARVKAELDRRRAEAVGTAPHRAEDA